MGTEGINYRSMTFSDIDGGLRLTRAAHWNQLRRDWEMFLGQSPDGCRVAVRNGIVIGTSATIRYQDCFSWIGMVLVDPEERGRGVGTELMRQALQVLADQRCVRLDATPAGEPLYRKLGFEEECRLSRMQAVISGPVPEGRTTVRPVEENDFQSIALFDRKTFGADRCFLLRWMWAGAPEYAWIAADASGIQGYIFGRHGYNFEHLGPIAASSVEVARDLVSACLPRLVGKPVIVDATGYVPDWREWLSSVGFQEQRPFIRMYRGEEPLIAEASRQFAVLGPEFG
ncbi:MAG TPA: GNAT family N-acetyltransferase [Acidobacteriota bacterium]|nr:GNAT family N-acetyltransferase [Acidobacteriota bacterium]